LKAKTDKLSETESTLFDRELELDLLVQDRGTTEGEMQKQLHEMEALLVQRNQELQDIFDRERSMEKTLGELQSDMADIQNGPSSSSAQSSVDEAVQLRAQLSALQQQLQSSTSEHNEREEWARQEVATLNETIARKKEQIESLEKQLQSLSVEFSSSQDQLVSKEADYRRLSLELEETLGDQLQSTRTVTSQVLESSTKEQAESVENMRSHIISLAQALERSETQRANAIERLLSERKASADSLRRLGESVKRFYSSLSYRDA
jgi:chromosome segregation ATPase